MVSYIPSQLHALLGRDLGSITEAKLERLVGAAEAEWLDAKRERYGNGDTQRRDLAADVAAFANRQGGLLVIGLDEGADGLISALAPIADTDLAGEELRISQIISGLVAPVPAFAVHRTSATSGGGYLVVSVPASVRRPHAVVVNEALRYPVREGTGKRYLSESEVATNTAAGSPTPETR
jgi:predicted HTH transcriptional regulator